LLKPLIARKFGIAYSPQAENIFPSLTVNDNLELGGTTLGNQQKIKQQKERIYQEFPLLAAKQNSRRNVRRRTPIPRNRLCPDVLPQSTLTR
jgi:ABC-type branched-subunit amino acid transport system ATPase component